MRYLSFVLLAAMALPAHAHHVHVLQAHQPLTQHALNHLACQVWADQVPRKECASVVTSMKMSTSFQVG